MSRDGDSPWSRRRSLLSLSSLNLFDASSEDGSAKRRKRISRLHGRTPSSSLLDSPIHREWSRDSGDATRGPAAIPDGTAKVRRPSLSLKAIHKRPGSTVIGIGSKSFGSPSFTTTPDGFVSDTTGEPLTASITSSSIFDEADAIVPDKMVHVHGEVQTSSGMFRKKKEYLVLTETHIIRYKSQGRAADAFKRIPDPIRSRDARANTGASQSDTQSLSESPGEKGGRVPLQQIVGVHRLDDGKPYFGMEVSYLDEEHGQSSTLTMQFSNPEEREIWLQCLRSVSLAVRLKEKSYISPANVEHVARIMERDNDYDPSNCTIFKVLQRQAASKVGRSSADDLTKVASSVCFLGVGVHKVHLIPLSKPGSRSLSPAFGSSAPQSSFGILTLTSVRVSEFDDALELTFRQPLQEPRRIHLASSVAGEIAVCLHAAENWLRPKSTQGIYRFIVPAEVEARLRPPVEPEEEYGALDRTLASYCVAYGLNPTNVRYSINHECEDAPRFQLLPPADPRRPEYGAIALLAIMRALRYNGSFASISFANINLDPLLGIRDAKGREHVCVRTKRGTPIPLSAEELGRSCLLVQEVRALAATIKRLRRMDFSGCIPSSVASGNLVPVETLDDDASKLKDIGCGIVKALFPLCNHQTTNVDWICLNGIQLSDTDLDYLICAAVDRSCHFRAIELNRCGLSDRSMGLILDSLRAQDKTLEAIQIAGNAARVDPVMFDAQLGVFGFIRRLDLSDLSRNSGNDPLLTTETLLIWRLQALRLSGTAMNAATVDSVATYLAHPQSTTLRELYVDNTYLAGADIATLLHSLTLAPGYLRDLHLDISQNFLSKGLEKITRAIADGMAPAHLSMRAIEYREESHFRKMLIALAANKTIQYLDMSQTALPGDASEDACNALYRLLAENDTLLSLDLSGEDTRLASSKFGLGINRALLGLKQNRTMQTFRIEKQKLGLQGASTLAEVIRENATLRELHCNSNEIPLQGLTDLVNSLIENTSLIYLPAMEDGRQASFRSAEQTMKAMSELGSHAPSSGGRPYGMSQNTMRRGLGSIRKSAVRAASAYTPSFPALPRSSSTTDDGSPSAAFMTLSTPASSKRQSRHSMTAPIRSFTVQDIQTTHRLLTEQWDRQCYRLAKYLDRNWSLYYRLPLPSSDLDEKFERPESVASLAHVLEQVHFDTTPRAERNEYFPPVSEMPPVALPGDSAPDAKYHPHSPVSLKQFLVAGNLKIDGALDAEEPTTPTQ